VEWMLGARSILLAHLLGPAAFGVWTMFRIGSRYAVFAGLGVPRGLEYQVVQSRGSAAPADAAAPEAYARTALGFLLLVSTLLCTGSLVASVLVADPRTAVALRGFAAAVVAEQLWLYGLVYLRAHGSLKRFALLEASAALLHLLLAVALAWRWGLPGAFAGFALAAFSALLLLARHVPWRPALSAARLKRLLAVGLPLVIVMAANTLLATADRPVVAAVGGAQMLGYYAFAVSAAGLAGTLAWVVRTVVFPDVYSRTHADGAGTAVRAHLEQTILPYAWCYAPLLGLCAFAIGPAVQLVLPQYTVAIEPARIFIFKGALAGLSLLGSLGVVAAARQRALPGFSLLALVVNVTLSYAALRTGAGLAGVAAAALMSQLVYDGLVLALVARAGNVPAPLRLVGYTLAPMLWCVVSVLLVTSLLPDPGLLQSLQAVALYLLLLLPLAPGIRRVLRLAHGSSRTS
jgi:O-antigen/teichoic acid export membrane protein